MKRRVAAALVLLGAACASPGIPPGGPPDSEAPVVRRIVPDSNAVDVRANAVFVHFDEVISERPSGGTSGRGIVDLGAVVDLSPSDGQERVNWRRTAIEIRPRGGFRPNTTYRVTLRAGVVDLRGNVLEQPLSFAFSTGPTMPAGVIDGVVFDWAAAAPARGARVELFLPADTTFRWIATADSSGRFRVRDLAAGTYAVRAWVDENTDRVIGAREILDTTSVALDSAATLELYAFVQDTIAPFLDAVERVDSTAIRLRFARAVQADWDPSGSVTILTADSVEVLRELSPIPGERFDSLMTERTPADSLAADSLAADSLAADTVRAGVPAQPPLRLPGVPPAAQPDSLPEDSLPALGPPAPVFGRPKPNSTFGLLLDAALPPGLYILRITGAPGLNGARGVSTRTFRVPEPTPEPEPDPVPPPVQP